MSFKENLKRICKERGTSPTAVLKRLNVSTSKVSLWYEGSLPKEDMLLRLAKELNCSVMDFFSDEEDLRLSTEPKDEDEEDILRVFRSLSRKRRHEFMSMVYEFEDKDEMDGDKANVVNE